MKPRIVVALIGIVAFGHADDTADVLRSEEKLESLRTPLRELSGQVARNKALVFGAGVRTVDIGPAPAKGRP